MGTGIAERGSQDGRVRTVAKTLDALNFDVKLKHVYDEHGNKLEGFARVNREDNGRCLSIVSKDYALVQHKEAMTSAVEILGREGWQVGASRIERYGSSAFVELTRRDAVNPEVARMVGEKVGERLMLRNSYDKTSALTFTLGALVLKCTNGLVVPGNGGLSFHGSHTGDLRGNFDQFLSGLAKIEAGLASRMLEHYSSLDKLVPSEIGREIIKRATGERMIGQIAAYWTDGIGRDGRSTAWNLYNGITQYLTHDFKGGWDRRERLNAQAFALIAGYIKTGALPVEAEAN